MADDTLTFTASQAAKIARQIPAIVLAVRAGIAKGAGFPIDETTIRVRRRELQAAVHERASKLTPTDLAEIAAVLVGEPDLLDCYTDEESSKSLREEVRAAITERIVGHVGTEMHRAISGQYAEADFASVVEEIRSTMPAVAERNSKLAETMESEISDQLSRKVPACRALLRTVNRAREILGNAGRLGDRPKLVQARVLMEVADLIDMKGYQLDRTHVAPVAPSP